MQSQTRRSLDGLLAIGPHPIEAQMRALTGYAARTQHTLDLFWTLLPGEDPAAHAPRSGFPIVAFDDEIARFTAEEFEVADDGDDAQDGATSDWHVAYAVPQPKSPTAHLPVYGRAGSGETGADAILRIGGGSLDLQLERIEAYSIRSALRLRGVYVASGPGHFQSLLRDFRVSDRARGDGLTLAVGARGAVEVHTGR
jgi:hypothetical protein